MLVQQNVCPQEPPEAERLTRAEVVDERDVSPRAPKPDTSGRRVRAIPARGGTTVLIRRKDFANHGIDNPDVRWDFRVDNFTVRVGPVLSQAAADFLTENYPTSFEYMQSG